jgi:hypothetical protein
MKSPVKRANHVTVERLILHVGPHKTGTTAIQTALHRNRESLILAGVFLPVNSVEHGQCMPVLREFFSGNDYEETYPWASKELDIHEILVEMAEAGCGTLLLSAEEFSLARYSDYVTRLLEVVSPQQLTIVVGMRPSMESVASWFSQGLKLFEVVIRKPPQSFMGNFEERLAWAWSQATLAESIASWRSMVVDSSLELLVFKSGVDVLDLFEQATGLSLPDRENLELNERLPDCVSRTHWDLQNFIDHSFSRVSPEMEAITTTLDGFLNTPVPEHECDCSEVVANSDVATIENAFSVHCERLFASATRVWGDPTCLESDSSRIHTVPRQPDNASHDLVVKMLLNALAKTGVIFSDMAEGNEFWQETSRRHEEAAEYWRRQFEELAGR